MPNRNTIRKKNHYEHLYTNKLDNQDEKNKLLKRHKNVSLHI